MNVKWARKWNLSILLARSVEGEPIIGILQIHEMEMEKLQGHEEGSRSTVIHGLKAGMIVDAVWVEGGN